MRFDWGKLRNIIKFKKRASQPIWETLKQLFSRKINFFLEFFERLAHTSLKSDLVLPDPQKIADFGGGYVFCSNFIFIHPNLFGESTERWKCSEECLGKLYKSYPESKSHNLVFTEKDVVFFADFRDFQIFKNKILKIGS